MEVLGKSSGFSRAIERNVTRMTTPTRGRRVRRLRAAAGALAAIAALVAATGRPLDAQSRTAPPDAPPSARLAPAGEPGARLHVSGVVVAADGSPVAGASIYAYQTDAEGYYGVKPASDSRNPRLFALIRSGAKGEWSVDTIRPGSYPASRAPGHIHFEVAAPGFAVRVFEIVFEGDPFITAAMRANPAFSVRPVEPPSAAGGPARVTERIVLERAR
jgi:protocatechuate 3,4-dioxygenase beta subunit